MSVEYGFRMQLSVFEVESNGGAMVELCRRVVALLGRRERFDLVPIDREVRRRRLTWQDAPAWWERVTFQ